MTLADRLRRQAAELLAIADELDGGARPSAPELLTSRHISIQALAGRLRTTEKTARKIANDCGARIKIGGRVYFDLAAIERHIAGAVNYRVLPCSSLFPESEIGDDASE